MLPVAHEETQLINERSNLFAVPVQDVLGSNGVAGSGLPGRCPGHQDGTLPPGQELSVVIQNFTRDLMVARQDRTFPWPEGLRATLDERVAGFRARLQVHAPPMQDGEHRPFRVDAGAAEHGA
jgi:hypothetical protein